MSDATFTLLAILVGIVLLSCAAGAFIALAAYLFYRRNESGLGEEDVAAILGYPMFPVWQARHNGAERHDDEEIAS